MPDHRLATPLPTFADARLAAMRGGAGVDASEVQSRPEHFDAAVDAPCDLPLSGFVDAAAGG